MTLTELRYVVALAQERHFGRAAQKCFVTQPTLSLALAKLEEELGVRLFERNKNEVLVTPTGAEIVEQARRVLDEAGKIARQRRPTLSGALRLGTSSATIGPYYPGARALREGAELALHRRKTPATWCRCCAAATSTSP